MMGNTGLGMMANPNVSMMGNMNNGMGMLGNTDGNSQVQQQGPHVLAAPTSGGQQGLAPARLRPEEHQHGFSDDARKLSPSHTYFGLAWHVGSARCLPKKFKCSLASVCDFDRWPMVK